MNFKTLFKTTFLIILWVLVIFIALYSLFAFYQSVYFIWDDPNGFLKHYDAVFLSLGTIITVGLIATYTTYLANDSSEKYRKADRIMQSELKIAEFRQKWIDDQRSDIALFTSLALHREDGEQLIELTDVLNRIRLRFNKLNPEEKERIEQLDQSLNDIMAARTEGDPDEQIEASTRIIADATEYLKLEWDRLQRDLHEAKGLNPNK